MDKNYNIFKQRLYNAGAIRPLAWEAIVQCMQQITLHTDERLIRKEGTLAYVADGILKEYDPINRKTPSIINFITPSNFIITRKHNASHYLKACTTTLIYYWDYPNLLQLYSQFNELQPIYNTLCAEYDATIDLRQFILEQHHANERILLFISAYKTSLNFIKKKDMANYLMLYYDNFIRSYRKLINAY